MKTKIFNIVIIVSLVWNGVNSVFIYKHYSDRIKDNVLLANVVNGVVQNLQIVGNYLNEATKGEFIKYVESLTKK